MRFQAVAPLTFLLIAGTCLASSDHVNPQADLILYNARVWTGDDRIPAAQAVATHGSKILGVGTNKEMATFRSNKTHSIDLQGKMLIPGFIDGHTHFENATDWFFEARLIDVDSENVMLERIAEVVQQVPEEFWITGTDWGGLTARKKWSAGDKDYAAFEPDLARVDQISGNHPLLLTRHDGAVFVNSAGLKLLRITPKKPNPSGGEIQHDATTGQLTGMLFGTAGQIAIRSLPPKARVRTLYAARELVKQLNAFGITSIHDIARLDAVSQTHVFHANVERSYSDESIFEDLRDSGDLTVRVYPLLPLANASSLAELGVYPGSGDELIRFGGLKAFIDGSLMFEPWSNNPNYAGDFTFRVVNEDAMLADIIAADKLGFDIATHAYGDKAHWLMLNWYEEAARINGPRDRRFRLIHALYPAEQEIERAGKFGAVADVTPLWTVTDRHSSENQLGPNRINTAYAWRDMINHGMKLNLVSDWPGSYDKTELTPLNPLENIYYAVARRAIGAEPESAWRPEQTLSIEEALRAYTVNPAWSSHEENIKGSITKGKLADLVVLSGNILSLPVEQLPATTVVMTVFNGQVVYSTGELK